jgi:hypothetical protein
MDGEAFAYEHEYNNELRHQRNLSRIALSRGIEEIAERIAEKLNEQIEKGHATQTFLIAIVFTIGSEFTDAIPGIGTLITLIIEGVLLYFLWKKGYFLKSRARLLRWILGFFIELIPFISLIPLKTIMVLIAWHTVRKRGKKAEKALESLTSQTLEELEELETDMEEYE